MRTNCHHFCHHSFLSFLSSLNHCFYRTYFNFVTKVSRETPFLYTLYLRFFKKTVFFINYNNTLNHLQVLVTLLVTLFSRGIEIIEKDGLEKQEIAGNRSSDRLTISLDV